MGYPAVVGPGKPAVAKLEVILNREVEGHALSWLLPSAMSSLGERRALEGVVRTTTFSLPRDVQRAPEALRAFAGARPHARLRVTCYIAEDGATDAEIRWIGGGDEDVMPNEYLRLEQRALALTAATALTRLAELDEGAEE